jgi:GNAT superfamily N-acetyltransferase
MFEIRKYSADLREKVLAFLGSVFPESGKSFEPAGRHSAFSDIERYFVGFWCLFDDDDIIGTVAVKRLSDTDCELKGLYVYEKYHGMGLGHGLAKTAVDFARDSGFERIVLDTVSTYDKALRLYKKMGFRTIDRYNNNERADVFMMKELKTKAVIREITAEDFDGCIWSFMTILSPKRISVLCPYGSVFFLTKIIILSLRRRTGV